MKATLWSIMLLVVGTMAFVAGRTTGRTAAFENGAMWASHDYELSNGTRAMAVLKMIESSETNRLQRILNNQVDSAILSALRTQARVRQMKMTREVQQMDASVQAVQERSYSMLADFRRSHLTQSEDKNLIEAVDELLKTH